jgi:predicted MPP superfamily phosphohydrolase
MMWIAILLIIVAVIICGLIYITASLGRFALIKRLRKKWHRRLISFAIIVLVSAAVVLTMGTADAVVIFLNFLMFMILFDIIVNVFARISGHRPRSYLQGWLAIITTVIYLAVGYYLCHNVWKTEYTLNTDKKGEDVRIAMLSDSHIGSTFDGEGFAAHIEEIERQNPDIVFIVGDFVDYKTIRSDMVRACEALGSIDARYGVWYAYGNHDNDPFRKDFSGYELKSELEKNGVHILEDEIAYAGDLCIAGRRDASSRDRKEISELLEGVDTDKYIVVLDHQPNDYEKESQTSADLVLSGHTHGGQLMPINYLGQWSGVLDKAYGHERRNGTDFIVSSGISDWAIDFKTGTRSEYVMVTIHFDTRI